MSPRTKGAKGLGVYGSGVTVRPRPVPAPSLGEEIVSEGLLEALEAITERGGWVRLDPPTVSYGLLENLEQTEHRLEEADAS